MTIKSLGYVWICAPPYILYFAAGNILGSDLINKNPEAHWTYYVFMVPVSGISWPSKIIIIKKYKETPYIYTSLKYPLYF
jgi:hypothetical protein